MQAQSNFKTVSIPGDGAVDVRRFWGKSHKRIKGSIYRSSLTGIRFYESKHIGASTARARTGNM